MPYVRRAPDGSIRSLHRDPEDGALEYVADDDVQLRGFFGAMSEDGFASLDAGFIRVLEDLIDALIRANVLRMTDLPVEAQNKLFRRKGKRRPTLLSELNLLGEATPFSASAAFPRLD